MILNVSGRCDIVAFYSKWFMNRYNAGFVDVRNPFNPRLISRIYFKDVDMILFCTKNPIPILNDLKKIDKPIIFHITITPYKKDIEPNVPNKKEIIEAVKKISKIVGIDNLAVRYDPILLSDKYNLDYHKRAFERLCTLLNGYVNKIIISFVDDYKEIGIFFSEIARKNNMMVQTCFEDEDLTRYGFSKGECLSKELAFKMTGKRYPKWTARKGDKCKCVRMVDIGVYNSCKHFCKYCYANFDEVKVKENYNKHNPNSSLLVGEINKDDIIKERVK